MRFCVECNQVTDDAGKAVESSTPDRLTFHFVDADDAAEAVLGFARDGDTEVVGRVYHVGEVQAAATVRRGRRSMMLHAYPEEEATWRRDNGS